MTNQEKEDRTARTIRERRERAAHGRTPPQTTVQENTPKPSLPAPSLTEEKRAEIRREIEGLKDRPVMRARRLAQYQAEKLSQGDIAEALGVRQPWISKRIALMQAPPEVLQQIEAGTLSENHYYNNRAEIEQSLTGASRTMLRDRPIPLTITLDAGRALAEILTQLAHNHNTIPIRLDDKATKKEIAEVLNLRATEIRQFVVKK